MSEDKMKSADEASRRAELDIGSELLNRNWAYVGSAHVDLDESMQSNAYAGRAQDFARLRGLRSSLAHLQSLNPGNSHTVNDPEGAEMRREFIRVIREFLEVTGVQTD